MSNSDTPDTPGLIIPLVLFSAFMIMQANFLVLPSLAIYIAEDFALTNHQLSILLASFSVAVAFANFGWSRILDKYNRKSILLCGGFLVTGVFVVTAVVSGFTGLVFSRVLMAIVMPLIGASVLPFVADIYGPKDRPRIMGYVMAAGYVVNLALIPVVIIVSDLYSWRWVTFGLAAFTAIVFIAATFSLPKPETPQPKQAGSGPNFGLFHVKNRAVLSNLLQKFLQTAGIFTVFAVYPTWLSSGDHGASFSSATMATIFFVAGVLGFFGSIASGRMNELARKISARFEPLLFISLLSAAFCFVVPFLGKGSPVLQFISYAPMIFFQSVAVVLLMNSLITSVGPAQRGYINAMSNIVFQAGIAVGSFVGFWIFEQQSIILVFGVAGVLLVASALQLIPKRDVTETGQTMPND